jgi:hypothetical protein
VDADEFQVATNAWQNGAVDNFANSGPWSYTVADSCTAGSLVGPRPLNKVTDGEDLGSEAGEKDFTGYTPLRFTDSSAPSLGTAANANAAQACTLTVDIKYANASVRAHGSMLIVYLGVCKRGPCRLGHAASLCLRRCELPFRIRSHPRCLRPASICRPCTLTYSRTWTHSIVAQIGQVTAPKSNTVTKGYTELCGTTSSSSSSNSRTKLQQDIQYVCTMILLASTVSTPMFHYSVCLLGSSFLVHQYSPAGLMLFLQ